MKWVCSDCGYESDNPGNCPDCEIPLLKREGEEIVEGLGETDAELDEFGDEDEVEEELS